MAIRSLRLFWPGLEDSDSAMRDFLRFTREAVKLRWQHPALRGEGFVVIHVHDQNRVLAFQRWIPGEGRDVIVGASFEQEHEVRLRNRLPGSRLSP